jgi:hypothetical protein
MNSTIVALRAYPTSTAGVYRDANGDPIRLVEFVYSNVVEQMGAHVGDKAAEIAYLGFMARNDPGTAASVCYEWLSSKPFADQEEPPRHTMVQFIKELTQVIFNEIGDSDRAHAWEQLMQMLRAVTEQDETVRTTDAHWSTAGVPAWCRPETSLLVAFARLLPLGDKGLPRILRRSPRRQISVEEMVSLILTSQAFGFDQYPKFLNRTLAETATMYHQSAPECWTRAGFRCTRAAGKALRRAAEHKDFSAYVGKLMEFCRTLAKDFYYN